MGKVKDFYHDEIVLQQRLKDIKEQFSKYVKSEGCGCCENSEEHKEAANALGELLDFDKFPEGPGYETGYNFYEVKSSN